MTATAEIAHEQITTKSGDQVTVPIPGDLIRVTITDDVGEGFVRLYRDMAPGTVFYLIVLSTRVSKDRDAIYIRTHHHDRYDWFHEFSIHKGPNWTTGCVEYGRCTIEILGRCEAFSLPFRHPVEVEVIGDGF